MPMIEPGKKAPAFALQDQDGKTHRLSDYAGRPVSLFFYPTDEKPGRTTEACSFQAALPKLKKSKAAVLGVSILDSASKAKFAKKHGLSFPLLADEENAVADKYGVWQEKSLYGRKFMGIARTTYLIGPDGKVEERWDNVKVTGHVEKVLEALTSVEKWKSGRSGKVSSTCGARQRRNSISNRRGQSFPVTNSRRPSGS